MKNIGGVLFSFVYLFSVWNLLFKMLLVGIFLWINGVSTWLCLRFVSWNTFLHSLRKKIFLFHRSGLGKK